MLSEMKYCNGLKLMLTTRRTFASSASSSSSSAIAAAIASTSSIAANQSDLMNEITKFSVKKTTPVSLQDLYSYGVKSTHDPLQRLRNSQYLHNELKIRIAQRVIELERLPLGLSNTRHIKRVRQGYIDHFTKMNAFPYPTTVADNKAFNELMKTILQDHSEVVRLMSRGVLDVRTILKPRGGTFDRKDQIAVDNVLNRFFLARIGLRFLVQQYIETEFPRPGFAGIIESACRPIEIIKRVGMDVMDICRNELGDAPEIICEQVVTEDARKWFREHKQKYPNSLSKDASENDVAFTYVTGHLEYMLSEVLKNAARATVETHGIGTSANALPPIKVLIVGGKDDVTIRVSDRGGGIKRDHLPIVWSYLNSSAGDPIHRIGNSDQDPRHFDHNRAVLAGYGIGLPLSRLYARYFGGDLDLKSLQGYGTDVYLHLSRLGHNCESLPPAVQHSPAERDSSWIG